jgi:hypothetical protein
MIQTPMLPFFYQGNYSFYQHVFYIDPQSCILLIFGIKMACCGIEMALFGFE